MEWEILAECFAFGSFILTSSISKSGSAKGVEWDASGVPKALILLFGWKGDWDELERLRDLSLPEFARASGDLR